MIYVTALSIRLQRSLVVLLSVAGLAAAAPQFQLPRGINLPPGINAANCPNFPFCTNNLAALAQPAQAAASTNSGAISGLLANARQLANDQNVPAAVRAQINNVLATARTGQLPQIQAQVNALLAQGQAQNANLPPQVQSQIQNLAATARQILPQAAPAAPAAPAAQAPSTQFTGLVGPSGSIGPSGLVGPAGPVAFGKKK